MLLNALLRLVAGTLGAVARDAEIVWCCPRCGTTVREAFECPACDYEPAWGAGNDRAEGAAADAFEEFESEEHPLM